MPFKRHQVQDEGAMPPVNIYELGIVTGAVFVCSLACTALVRRMARRYGWLAQLRQDRWHKEPTALHGGVGFFPPFFLGGIWVLVGMFGMEWHLGGGALSAIPKEITLAATALFGTLLMFASGLWDDLKPFRPATKLLSQLIAVSAFVYAGGIFALTGFYMVDLLLTYFWFVGITNAMNMLDNMDGLASGVAIIASLSLVVLACGVDDSGLMPVVPLGLIFIAALLGFWVFNRSPATIFMGDSGSLFIGYMLAAMALPGPFNAFLGIAEGGGLFRPVLTLMIPSMILAIPIFDTTLVTITRTWSAQRAYIGGKDHSSHRLVRLGLSEKRAVWVLYMMGLFAGALAILMQRFPDLTLPLSGLFVLILVLTGVHLGHVKVERANGDQPPPAWAVIVSTLLYRRHTAEVLLDTVLIAICFYGAYLLRFGGILSPEKAQALARALPLVVASCLLSCFLSGTYRSQWRLISLSDLPGYGIGVLGGSTLSLAVVTLVTRFGVGHSRSVYVIFGFLFFFVLVGSRLSFSLLDTFLFKQRSGLTPSDWKPVLIYGAGKAGKLLHGEIMSNSHMRDYVAVGFIDDDPEKIGRNLCGTPVRRQSDWLRADWNRLPEIWVSSLSIPDEAVQGLRHRWPAGITIRRLRIVLEPFEGEEGRGVTI